VIPEENAASNPEPAPDAGAATVAPDAPAVPESPEAAPEAPESTTVDNPAESKGPESSEDPTKEPANDTEIPGELYFNGEQVQVDIPEELSSTLTEAGVDVNKVVSELYGKDSDFTLSDEARKPLDDLYGKAIVDTYLGALKAQNESALKGAKDAKEAASKAEQAAAEWSNELVGGEENWEAMSTWAEASLTDSELDSFNKAMGSGDKWMQELAIKALQSRYKDSEGDQSAQLVTADHSSGTDTDNSPMTREQYHSAMAAPEFRNLGRVERQQMQQKLDARRQAGINKGL